MESLRSYWGDHEFHYEIRYDKKSNHSFEPLWQKANHLVTCSEEYKKENCRMGKYTQLSITGRLGIFTHIFFWILKYNCVFQALLQEYDD